MRDHCPLVTVRVGIRGLWHCDARDCTKHATRKDAHCMAPYLCPDHAAAFECGEAVGVTLSPHHSAWDAA